MLRVNMSVNILAMVLPEKNGTALPDVSIILVILLFEILTVDNKRGLIYGHCSRLLGSLTTNP